MLTVVIGKVTSQFGCVLTFFIRKFSVPLATTEFTDGSYFLYP